MNTFSFISKRTKIISERNIENSDLRYCKNEKCRKFINPNELGIIMDFSRYKTRKYCNKSCACSQRNKRVEYKQEWKDKQSSTLIKMHELLGTYYIPENQKLTYNQYKRAVRSASQRTLKRLDRALYNRYVANAWNPDNPKHSDLTIEHKIAVRQCYNCGISIKQASNINNIEVITMKQNWENREK